jgi:type I restriction enzyme S subunit
VSEENTRRALPKGWKWMKLGDVARYLNGRPFKPEEWSTEGTPIIRIQNLNSFNAPFNYYKGDVDPANAVENGDLLVSWSASLDAYLWNRGPAVLNQHIFKVIENADLITREYLYFGIRHAMEEIRDQVHGATMRHITKPEFEKVCVPVPPIPEQRRMSETLQARMEAAERAKAAAEAQLAAADRLPSAFLQSIFGDAVAGRWPKVKLGDLVISYRNGFGRRPQGIENGPIVLRLADVSTGHINLERPRRVSMTKQEISTYGVVGGDLLFVRVNGSTELVGRCVLVESPQEDLVFNDHLIRVRLKSTVLPQFVRAVADLPVVRGQVLELATTTAGQLTVNQEMLGSIELQVPDLETQRRVIDIIARQGHKQAAMRESLLQQLETLRGVPYAILRHAFQGELS